MVHYSGMSQNHCEIGDLLVVHVHTEHETVRTRRALLLQAKMYQQEPSTLKSSGDRDQLRLYSNWPKYRYTQPRPLTDQERDIRQAPHSGARYMLIHEHRSRSPYLDIGRWGKRSPLHIAPPSKHLRSELSFAKSLYGLLVQSAGRGFSEKNSGQSTAWSQVVWDLITLAMGKAFNRSRSNYVEEPRLAQSPSTDLRFFDGAIARSGSRSSGVTSTVRELYGSPLYNSEDNEPPSSVQHLPVAEGSGGPSLILIETSYETGQFTKASPE
jgi:hypothetical protein